jgi:hypothetical protein
MKRGFADVRESPFLFSEPEAMMQTCFHVMAAGDRLPSNAEREMTVEPPH